MRRLVALGLALGAVSGLAGCGGGKIVEARPETVVGTIATPTLPKGNASAGKSVFTSSGCASCHTLAAAGAKGNVGPNLDQALKGKPEEFIRESIVNPNAQIAPGFQPNIMPQDYGSKLSPQQLADLVAFLAQSTR